MIFSREFFALNFAFVDQAAAVLRRPWPELLLDYTHTYRRFRLGAVLDSHNPVWLQFLDGVRQAGDRAGYAHRFHLERERAAGPLKREQAFGCFSYELEHEGSQAVVRIHFTNPGIEENGPLSQACRPRRQAELAEMFSHARQAQPSHVMGASWLYNLPAYCRLFPPAYTAHLTPCAPDFPMLALWGQFLDHQGRVRADLASLFLERVRQARTMEDLAHAFPYPILKASAGIKVFYAFYQTRS